MKRNASKSILAIIAIALVVGVALYLLGGKDLQTPQAGGANTASTSEAAAAAGARVLPTDPPLKVEPK